MNKEFFKPLNLVFYAVVLAAIVYGSNKYFRHHGASQMSPSTARTSSTDVEEEAGAWVKLPAFSPIQARGEGLFNENCSACHGKNASGTESGPPLIHIIYEPSHHGDGSFYRAAANGVQAHHWRFGDMPKVETIKKSDMKYIVSYIRSVQRENGIN